MNQSSVARREPAEDARQFVSQFRNNLREYGANAPLSPYAQPAGRAHTGREPAEDATAFVRTFCQRLRNFGQFGEVALSPDFGG